MNDLLASILLPATGIIMSPTPVAALLFIFINSKDARNSLAFLTGWVASFALVMMAVIFITETRSFFDSYQDITPLVYAAMLGMGIFLILFALYSWLKRPCKDASVKSPKWLHSMGNITPLKSFGIACVLAGFSPKNGMLAVTGAIAISALSSNLGESVVFTLLFLVIVSFVILIPVSYFAFVPKNVKKVSRKIESIIYRSSASMAIVLAVTGVTMVAYSALHMLGM